MNSLGFCDATCQSSNNHRRLSSLVESDETRVSDHLPRGFPPYFAVWTQTRERYGDLKLNLRCGSLGGLHPARLMMVRGGNVATWSCVSPTVTADISTSDNLSECSTNPHTRADTHAHSYTHVQKPIILDVTVANVQLVKGGVVLFQRLWLIAKLSLEQIWLSACI